MTTHPPTWRVALVPSESDLLSLRRDLALSLRGLHAHAGVLVAEPDAWRLYRDLTRTAGRLARLLDALGGPESSAPDVAVPEPLDAIRVARWVVYEVVRRVPAGSTETGLDRLYGALGRCRLAIEDREWRKGRAAPAAAGSAT